MLRQEKKPEDVKPLFAKDTINIPFQGNIKGNTPFHNEIRSENKEDTDLFESYIKLGADLTLKNAKGLTPADLAVLYGKFEYLLIILKNTNKDDNTGCGKALHDIIFSNYPIPPQIDALLEAGAAVEAIKHWHSPYGNTFLHELVKKKNSDMIALLLYAGFSLDEKNIAGRTPEGLAIQTDDNLQISNRFFVNYHAHNNALKEGIQIYNTRVKSLATNFTKQLSLFHWHSKETSLFLASLSKASTAKDIIEIVRVFLTTEKSKPSTTLSILKNTPLAEYVMRFSSSTSSNQQVMKLSR